MIIPHTEKGRQWVQEEMANPKDKHGKDMAITINSEFTDEMAQALKEKGLEVEVK